MASGEPRFDRVALQQALDSRRDQVTRRWLLAKQAVWLALLVGAFLVFFLLDLMNESMVLAFARY